MALKLSVAPTIEPISLAEARLHLRLDSGSLADNLTSVQSIAPGSHGVAAAFSLAGVAVEVLGYETVVNLEAGTNGAGGTVDVKLQDSDDNITFTDVVSGAFTQVTEANDNATYEKAYTGGRRYLKAVATVAGAACEFGVMVLKKASTSAEDSLINSYIKAARKHCQDFQNRQYINATMELWLDEFPCDDEIVVLPCPLVSVTSIEYYDIADVKAVMPSTDYFVDSISEPGRICLKYGKVWPFSGLREHNAVCITMVVGHGATIATVPDDARSAMLLIIGHLYEHREAVTDKSMSELPMAVDSLLWMSRVF